MGFQRRRSLACATVFALAQEAAAFVPHLGVKSHVAPTSSQRSSQRLATSMLVPEAERKTVVVIGNGMVGHKFCEAITEYDTEKEWKVVTFCEEPRSAYNRMRLTEYFTKRDLDDLSLAGEYKADGKTSWYDDNGVDVFVGDKAISIDREAKVVKSAQGREVAYDKAVLATGSFPFVPPTPGMDRKGVFVYRTIEDLENMIAYQKENGVTSAAVIGGGLLGLEAAKAMHDLGLSTHVIEFAPILMCRQIDEAGNGILSGMIESMGLKVHCGARTSEVLGDSDKDGAVTGLRFSNEGWADLDVGMVVVSAGIRPRDEIARQCGIDVHERGGVQINNNLQTSDPDIYAIGEVALHGGMIYGLVAPGYSMAEAVAKRLMKESTDSYTGEEIKEEDMTFSGADMSTKLKLMGVDVASFGKYSFKPDEPHQPLVWNDPFSGVYRKLVFNPEGTKLLGGILVGDASDFGTLLGLSRSSGVLPVSPKDLLPPAGIGGAGGGAAIGVEDMADDMQVCSCNDVSKGRIMDAVIKGGCATMGELKTCTKAATGCGGCEPMVKNLFTLAMESTGQTVNNHLCEHFEYSRSELFEIIKISGYKTFDEVLEHHGKGDGCEACKPAVASILAGIWNDMILDGGKATLQDTNDRSLANMQRGGTYSVIPRVPAGEITPDALIAMAEVAKEYNLYTKVTGAQRIDLLGAERHDLPDIWEKLNAAGLESGHAYGKSLRTVKACVGKTWCRYGMNDSMSLGVRIENRYKGLRSPHKLKSGVSACIRECAEAQCKDFGLIATETGYNLYVCGNGGAQPRHGDLLATGIDDDLAIKYIDRFLMYYVATAEKLERTARWIERMEGGIEHLKDVVIHDKLGVCDKLEAQMQYIVDTYQDEWASVVNDPKRRAAFKQFVNTDETETTIATTTTRGQRHPVVWPKDGVLPPMDAPKHAQEILSGSKKWYKVGTADQFPANGGATVRYGKSQLAVYNLEKRGEWYATQNVCPHKRALVLSQGLTGDRAGQPKVACPLHKKTFNLATGECFDAAPEEGMNLMTFPVKLEAADNSIWLELPPASELDQILGTAKVAIAATGADAEVCEAGCDHKDTGLMPAYSGKVLNSFIPLSGSPATTTTTRKAESVVVMKAHPEATE